MSCFPCFSKDDENDEEEKKSDIPVAQPKVSTPPSTHHVNKSNHDPIDDIRNAPELEDTTVRSFTFREIATATKNFRQECLLGEGAYGKVFKGTLQATGQTVAVRQLERNTQGNNFVFEISTLSLLQHPNLVKMVGYCADGEQRFLVYEYHPSGSLKSHLFDHPAGEKPLDWTQRMKIALGVAEALQYLHEEADPTIIYRDLRSSNILLTEMKSPKLTHYGLAKIVHGGNKMHSVMTDFNGCYAPEIEKNGELTVKSDVYSFGVVLLELITGRKALDTSLPAEEQSLVSWAQPLFKDPSKFPNMADPLLRKGFAVTSLNQAVGVAAMCLMEEPLARPLISDISAALSFLAMAPPQAPVPDPTPSGGDDKAGQEHDDSSSESEEEEVEEEEDDHQEQQEYSSDEQSETSDEEETQRSTSNADEAQGRSPELASSSKCSSMKKSMGSQSRSGSRSNNKKSMRIESRSDSRSNNKKAMKSHSDSRSNMKAQTPPDSSSSSDEEPPPPQPQPPHDEDQEYSSSDDEVWDDHVDSSSPQEHEAIVESSDGEETDQQIKAT